MHKPAFAVLTLLCSAPLFAAPSPAKEPACRMCHGPGGAAPMAPSYPKLAGQNKDYLISAMKAYRDGKRNDSMAIMMAAQMMSLSDSDIEELATFYSLQ